MTTPSDTQSLILSRAATRPGNLALGRGQDATMARNQLAVGGDEAGHCRAAAPWSRSARGATAAARDAASDRASRRRSP